MTQSSMRRPEADECAPFYAGYIALVPDGDVVEAMRKQRAEIAAECAALTPDLHGHRYAEEKWSVAEVLAHIADTERLFSYRAMHFARGMSDEPLAGIDQEIMAAHCVADRRTLASLAQEFDALRAANIELFGSFAEAEFDRRGIASGGSVSVRALVYMCYGHAAHHVAILRERYLVR